MEKECRKEYYRKNNKDRREKKREEENLEKYKELRSKLEETKKNNKDWFDPNRNPYLNRLNSEESKKYNLERKKRFLLEFDMDNLHSRTKHGYAKRRENAFNNWYLDKDLFHRIQYYRIFRREFKKRMGGESPDKTNQLMNNCFIPNELHPESSTFRPELLHLLDEGEDSDPKMEVMTPREWAQKLVDEDSSDSYDSDFNGE